MKEEWLVAHQVEVEVPITSACLILQHFWHTQLRGSQDWQATLHGTEYETNSGASGPFESQCPLCCVLCKY